MNDDGNQRKLEDDLFKICNPGLYKEIELTGDDGMRPEIRGITVHAIDGGYEIQKDGGTLAEVYPFDGLLYNLADLAFKNASTKISYDVKKAHYAVIAAIILKDGKYLIVQRSPGVKVYPSQWTVPGGKLETSDYEDRPKDTPTIWYNVLEAALEREVSEEVGLRIKNVNYLTSLAYIRPDGIPTVALSMYADYLDGEVVLCDELVDHAWVTLDESIRYDLIEGIHEELVMRERLRNGESGITWEKSDPGSLP